MENIDVRPKVGDLGEGLAADLTKGGPDALKGNKSGVNYCQEVKGGPYLCEQCPRVLRGCAE